MATIKEECFFWVVNKLISKANKAKHMMTKTILTIIVAVCLFPILSNAEEGKPVISKPVDAPQGKVMPAAIQRFTHDTKEVVKIKNIVEEFLPPSIHVKYNKDGYLDNFISSDGTEIKYSYRFDKGGELSAIVLTGDGGFSLELRAMEDKNEDLNISPSDDATINRKVNPPDDGMGDKGKPDYKGGGGEGAIKPGDFDNIDKPGEGARDSANKPTPPIVVYIPRNSLKNMAQKPAGFDFNAIKNGFDKASEEKRDAYEVYLEKTTPYYAKMLNELRANSEAMKADGIKLNVARTNSDTGGSISVKERKSIDEAVRNIRVKSKIRHGAAMRYEKFLAIEKMYADDILGPGMELYESRMKKVVKKINGIVDRAMKSELAVYLDTNDRIEAVINLPEAQTK
ncbi:MAG: hypothetical protein WC522_01900 [Candidatus Omnitrophota bacterium]